MRQNGEGTQSGYLYRLSRLFDGVQIGTSGAARSEPYVRQAGGSGDLSGG